MHVDQYTHSLSDANPCVIECSGDVVQIAAPPSCGVLSTHAFQHQQLHAHSPYSPRAIQEPPAYVKVSDKQTHALVPLAAESSPGKPAEATR